MRSSLKILLAICFLYPIWSTSAAIAAPPAKSADQIYADAMAASENAEYRRALDLLELAHLKDAQPRFVYRRILVLEQMGKRDRARQLLATEREALAGQPGVGDLSALEQRLREEDAQSGNTAQVDWLGWGLIGTGTAASVSGLALFLLAENHLDEVRCSHIYPESQRTGCSDVDAPAHLTRAEFDERMARVDTYRIVGGSLIAVGALTLGYGGYRLIMDRPIESDPTDRTDRVSAPSWRVGVSVRGEMALQLTWMF